MEPRKKQAAIVAAVLLCVAAFASSQNGRPGTEGKIPAGQMWMICVVPDMAKLTEPQASVEKSTELDKLLTSKGNHKVFIDSDSAPDGAEPYVVRAKKDDKEGVGRILIMDDRGRKIKDKIVDSQPMSDDKAAIALAIKWGGK